MKPWKVFALASVALNLGILVAVGLFWLRANEDWEYEEWLAELELSETQEERMWSLVNTRFDTAETFFDGLDVQVDQLIEALEAETPNRVALLTLINRVEAQRVALSTSLNTELIDFLLELEPEQRVETLFFLLDAEDLAVWFF